MRAVKDREELKVMREAAELISEVFRRVVAGGETRHQRTGSGGENRIHHEAVGSERSFFDTIVAAGARSAWAHAQPTAKILKKSELVVLDHGAILRGYCSDLTRTIYLGRTPQKVRKLYDAVLEAQTAAKNAIRPGVTAGEVDAAARGTLRRHGLDEILHAQHRAHGLGLEIHEMPRLGKGEKFVLQEGMVVTVEPGVYVEGLGGIRVEDDVVVSAQGAEELTNAPRELIEN